jgi:hypothetical protein
MMTERIDSSLADMSSWEPMSPPIKEDGQMDGLMDDNSAHLVNHGTESATEGAELAECFFEHGGEGKEAESMACWSGVEHDDGELHQFDVSAGEESCS